MASAEEAQKSLRYFKTEKGQYGEGDQFIGVRMGNIFKLVVEFADMPIAELEKLLDSPIHEYRAGAVSIMDKASRKKKLPDERRKAFFDLYVRRHDRINNWDLVDLGALHMVGMYLKDKPRDILYRWATSDNIWERRSAIVGTAHLIRQKDLDDTFKIAEILVSDTHDLIHKGVGWMLRFAGDKDHARLLAFLDKHAATMPRTMLRYAIEKFDAGARNHYMNLKNATS
ncbi:DNA alkylation repair enzyme [Flavobacterium caeni]|uniref:DNA alkylation repair enzyme n=2 Tax=Flavobacterium caeni TaxID=490189 RepID=A0A1G5ITK3_9FLAO|nr:DNA alkylation repair enzyme [Flavobacterium caeni]